VALTGCAVLGSGNIASDLVSKLLASTTLDLVAVAGIDPDSPGLARARGLGVPADAGGIDWLLEQTGFGLVFDATSAHAHHEHAPRLAAAGLTAIDLTPAALGPGVIPTVNLDAHLDEPNISLVTCGGQATTPVVAAISSVCEIPYAEIVSTIASLSAGPGTRANIDEFTRTTAAALRTVGRARASKAIIVLNPADPPILMRNTVYCALPDGAPEDEITAAIHDMVAKVAAYVPGYRLKAEPVFDEGPFATPGGPAAGRVACLLEVEGAGHHLPAYAGNLDIMTAAAVKVGEEIAVRRGAREGVAA
jgi:acetaldehyde dehydrogenase